MFFELTNDTQKTSQTIQRFLKRRNDMLMSNGPNLNRWIERLTNNNGSGDNGGAGFALGGGQASANGGGANAATLSSATANRAVNDQVQREPYALGGPSAHKSGVGASINSVFASSYLFDNASVGPAGAPTSTLPLGFTIGDESGNRMSFSTSLMQVAQATAESKRRKFAGGEEELAKLGINGASPASPKQFGLDIWVEGHIVHFDEGEDGGKSDGDFGVLYFGADYVLSPHILIGALVQFDKMSEMSVDRSTKTEGHGWMIGPYATVRLSNNLFVQGRAAWGQSENDISPFLTSTDTYDTERWLVEGSIQGRWAAGSLTISPRASIGYIEEDQEAYTDSFGVLIPTQTISLGQARFGPQVSYQLRASDGTTVEPYAEIEAIWNFDESGTNLVASTLASTQDWRGKAGIGVRAVSSGGVALDLSGAYDGIGTDDLDAISGEAKLRFPLN